MAYIEGFVTPVPTAQKAAYRRHVEATAPLFKEAGATRMVETWEEDVPRGTTTDFFRAVDAQEHENIVFSWIEFPDKATRDTGMAQLMADPRMIAAGEHLPFDGKRVIFGGFDPFVDDGAGGRPGYVDGYLLAVPDANKAAYQSVADGFAAKAQALGALRIVEAWGDDVPDGHHTHYRRAVQAETGESVVFSWAEWPDKATRDAAWAAIMADPDIAPQGDPPFDGKRMFWGGFEPVFDA